MNQTRGSLLKAEYHPALERLTTGAGTPPVAPENAGLLAKCRSSSGLAAMGAVYDALERPFSARRPVVGVLCNFVPEEFILAVGAIPLRLCSQDSACAAAGDRSLPADVCPLIKSIAGSCFNGLPARLDLIVIPATCDGKIKLTELLNLVSDTFLLDLPRNAAYPERTDLVTRPFEELWQHLKQRYKPNAGRRELLQACALTNRRTNAFRALFEFRAAYPGAINAFDYFALASASNFLEPEAWISATEAVLAEARKHRPTRMPGHRILLAGSPIMFPNFKLLELLQEADCDVAADLLCSAYGRLYDPVVVDEETESALIRAIALRAVAPSLCPCYPGINKSTDRMLDLVAEFRLDGVIYHQLRLCQVFDLQAAALRQILKDRTIPALFLKTDLGREDRGQLKTRIEAFLELMKPRPDAELEDIQKSHP